MQKSPPLHNISASLVIETCLAFGIAHFCLAPGSRSTPLALAIGKKKEAATHIHFDERGLAFFALGLSLKHSAPVAIITTSGSAVGNLLPALMEADASHLPLILITADRPFELKECGANQTTCQTKIFTPFVRHHIDLPADTTSPKALQAQISHTLLLATHPRPGPIHINCQLREPLTLPPPISITPFLHGLPSTNAHIEEWIAPLSHVQRGVIIAGSGVPTSSHAALEELSKKLHWPLLTDPLSNLRSCRHIAYVNHTIQDPSLPFPEAVIHYGGPLVSKPFLQWIERAAPPFYGHISPYTSHYDPLARITHRLIGTLRKASIPLRQDASYLHLFQKKSAEKAHIVSSFFAKEASLSEPGLIYFLSRHLPSSWTLFSANSMPIRDIDTFFFPKKPLCRLLANRGVSGIDGNIATAAGCADIALIGDLATLHDLNSLALLPKRSRPLILLLINNQGGGIFSFLPGSQSDPLLFETHFAAAHPFTFQDAARQFHLPYLQADSKQTLEMTLRTLFKNPQTILIEIPTNRLKNYELHREIDAKLIPSK